MDAPPPLDTKGNVPKRSAKTKKTDFFRTDDLLGGIGRRTARGAAHTLGATGFNFAVTTIATVLVTRQLTADDFGLYGMVIVLTGFAGLFIDLGLTRAVVQKPVITQEQVSTLFWINLVVATTMAVMVAVATPLVIAFYDEPRLKWINIAMASLFIVSALARQHAALLERRMEFAKINLARALAALVGSMSSVLVAYMGGGYWALVALPMGSTITQTIVLWSVCPWAPGLARRHTGVRKMLAFGGHITGFQILSYFSSNADNAMLGFAWGTGPLGLYTRAYSLMMLPATKLNAPLNGVIVPALSRMVDHPHRYRSAFRRTVGLTAAVATPAIAVVITVSPQLIPLLFGDEWRAMVPIFIALSGAALHTATRSAGHWVCVSLGNPDRMLRWGLLSSPVTIIAIAIGLQWGAMGVAIAVSVWQLAEKLPAFVYMTRDTCLNLRDLVGPICFPTLGSLVACGLIFTLDSEPLNIFGNFDGIGILLIKASLFTICYVLLSAMLPSGRDMIRCMRGALRTLFSRGGGENVLHS